MLLRPYGCIHAGTLLKPLCKLLKFCPEGMQICSSCSHSKQASWGQVPMLIKSSTSQSRVACFFLGLPLLSGWGLGSHFTQKASKFANQQLVFQLLVIFLYFSSFIFLQKKYEAIWVQNFLSEKLFTNYLIPIRCSDYQFLIECALILSLSFVIQVFSYYRSLVSLVGFILNF